MLKEQNVKTMKRIRFITVPAIVMALVLTACNPPIETVETAITEFTVITEDAETEATMTSVTVTATPTPKPTESTAEPTNSTTGTTDADGDSDSTSGQKNAPTDTPKPTIDSGSGSSSSNNSGNSNPKPTEATAAPTETTAKPTDPPTPTPEPTPTSEPTSEPKPTPTPKPVWGWAKAKGTIRTTYDSATNGSNIPIEIPNMPVSGETCDGELTGYGKTTDATEEAVWNYLDNKFGEDFCGVGHLKVVDGSVHW